MAEYLLPHTLLGLTWEYGLNLHDPILVSRPHSPQEGSIIRMEIGNTNLKISDVQFSQKLFKRSIGRKVSERGVGSSCITMPEVEEDIR